jgi:hypothetical protein
MIKDTYNAGWGDLYIAWVNPTGSHEANDKIKIGNYQLTMNNTHMQIAMKGKAKLQ